MGGFLNNAFSRRSDPLSLGVCARTGPCGNKYGHSVLVLRASEHDDGDEDADNNEDNDGFELLRCPC